MASRVGLRPRAIAPEFIAGDQLSLLQSEVLVEDPFLRAGPALASLAMVRWQVVPEVRRSTRPYGPMTNEEGSFVGISNPRTPPFKHRYSQLVCSPPNRISAPSLALSEYPAIAQTFTTYFGNLQ